MHLRLPHTGLSACRSSPKMGSPRREIPVETLVFSVQVGECHVFLDASMYACVRNDRFGETGKPSQ